jgi:membrane protein DedA with SNARE-associated domain
MDGILPFLIQHGYAVLFISVLVETMGLPLPSVPLLITMGALAGAGQVNLFLCIGLGVCAALLSDIVWYTVGRKRGSKVLSSICRITLEPDSCVRRTERIFGEYGARSLLITKFFPGLSAVSTPLAGIISMPLSRFALYDVLGILLWIGAYTIVGYIFSEELDRALDYAGGMGKTLFVFVVGGLTIYILWKYSLRRRFLRQLVIARITPDALKQKIDAGENILIIDVRHSLDFEADPYVIPGALRMSLDQAESYPALSIDRETVVYCT